MPMLDTRPESIALLDAEGVILAVNAAWRRFALDNGIRADGPVPGPGIDYPALCDAARGDSSQGATEAAAGIRAVLAKHLPGFSLEYPCHSPERQRWFMMMVTPIDLAGARAMVVHVGITERKLEELRRRDSELRLQLALDENRRLGRELMRLQEAERAALAKELHDELSQQLVAIRAYAGAIERRTAGTRGRTHLDAHAIGKAAGEIYDISHRLMEGLHPQVLDSAGLSAAIANLVAHWSKARPKLRLRVIASGPGPEDARQRIQLFRIVQECLANAVQHGQASRIRIFVGERGTAARRRLRVVVRDDGIGMRLDEARTGYGLIIMRERVLSLGGRLELRSQAGRGLRVSVDIPLRD